VLSRSQALATVPPSSRLAHGHSLDSRRAGDALPHGRTAAALPSTSATMCSACPRHRRHVRVQHPHRQPLRSSQMARTTLISGPGGPTCTRSATSSAKSSSSAPPARPARRAALRPWRSARLSGTRAKRPSSSAARAARRARARSSPALSPPAGASRSCRARQAQVSQQLRLPEKPKLHKIVSQLKDHQAGVDALVPVPSCLRHCPPHHPQYKDHQQRPSSRNAAHSHDATAKLHAIPMGAVLPD